MRIHVRDAQLGLGWRESRPEWGGAYGWRGDAWEVRSEESCELVGGAEAQRSCVRWGTDMYGVAAVW